MGRARVFLSAVSRKLYFIIDSKTPSQYLLPYFRSRIAMKVLVNCFFYLLSKWRSDGRRSLVVAGSSRQHKDLSYFAGEGALGRVCEEEVTNYQTFHS